MENGLLKSLLLNQPKPSNLSQQENIIDMARMIGILTQQSTNECKNQSDLLWKFENYRNFMNVPKQPFDLLQPMNNNRMFNFFPQFQTSFQQLPFMTSAPLNLSSTQPTFPNYSKVTVKTEKVNDNHDLKSKMFLKRPYDNITPDSVSIKEEPSTSQNLSHDSGSVDVEFDVTAPYGRSKSGKALKRPGFIPSYMENGRGPYLCVVCDKEASGLHYKAMTCEGCKGFFRRTIQQHLVYDCKFGDQCDVSRKTKKDVCRKCRWGKCLTSGMATSSVLSEDERRSKNDLIKNNKLKRVRPKTDLCLDIQNNSLKSDDTESFQEEGTFNSEIIAWIKSLNNIYQTINYNGNWNIADKFRFVMKNLPGFDKINGTEKYQLFAARAVQCLILLSLYSFSDNKRSIQLPEGSIISKATLQYSTDNFSTQLLNIAEKTHSFCLNQSEQCIMFALVLLVNYKFLVPGNEYLDDLERKYLNLLNHIMPNSNRRSQILLFVFPELLRMSDQFDLSTNDWVKNIKLQLEIILEEFSEENNSNDDEPIPLVIKVD